MVLIFDLDDTLYDEMTYVMSGLRAVARFGKVTFGWDAQKSLTEMQTNLLQHGRGEVFDQWLRSNGHYSISGVAACVKIYRHHQPEIKLSPQAARLLKRYQDRYPLYMVTDGHKVVQQKKIEALGISHQFKRIFITHRYGVRHAKPSLYCFDIIRKLEQCEWSQMVYVGDNPAKDFVNLNRMEALTVRVLTGSHASVVASPEYDGRLTVPDLANLTAVLDKLKKSEMRASEATIPCK